MIVDGCFELLILIAGEKRNKREQKIKKT